MSNHTPEPWVAMPTPPASFSDHGWRALAKCGSLFMVAAPSEVVLRYENNILVDKKWDHEANARRIVACVNACRGLSTKELEENGLISAAGHEMLNLDAQLAAVTAQRDELLQAMRQIAFATAPEPDDGSEHENAYSLAMDAIEKCEVQNG